MVLLGAITPALAQAPKADEVLAAVVGVHAEVPAMARTADSLGTSRNGSGIVIGADGLVLTIGYLILEAGAVDIIDASGKTKPAALVAYDNDSGFGLLRSLQPLDAQPIGLGDSAALKPLDRVLIASRSDGLAVEQGMIAGRRELAGYWEYLLPDAVFAVPPHAEFGGAALIDRNGRLVGVGSLLVGDAAGDGTAVPGNMYVPIDALKPILQDLVAHGRRTGPQHPWLGVYAEADRGGVRVLQIAEGGPAEKAGLQRGDLITGVAGTSVNDLADFYRQVWALGPAGVAVPLDIEGAAGPRQITVRSLDRYQWLRLDPTF
ncbi:MAG TPA: S1C family serine protease [Dongiaceae bacterium]|nr:S1C family serine protease [Dongiaceae bacterium]